jgi:hypothetical protein
MTCSLLLATVVQVVPIWKTLRWWWRRYRRHKKVRAPLAVVSVSNSAAGPLPLQGLLWYALAHASGSVNSCEMAHSYAGRGGACNVPLLPDLTAGASPLPDANDAVTLVGAQRARPWRLRYHGDNFGWSQREDPSVFNAGDRLVVSLLRRLMTANTTTPILWWLSLITHRRVSRRAGRVVNTREAFGR